MLDLLLEDARFIVFYNVGVVIGIEDAGTLRPDIRKIIIKIKNKIGLSKLP